MAFRSIQEEDDHFDMTTDAKTEKYNQIRACLKNGSLWELREMALTRGGLVNRKLVNACGCFRMKKE